jgi:hypothetical protein
LGVSPERKFKMMSFSAEITMNQLEAEIAEKDAELASLREKLLSAQNTIDLLHKSESLLAKDKRQLLRIIRSLAEHVDAPIVVNILLEEF